ncbi:MAG TPA: alkaline phosphatase family protein, partial [Acidobacteriota bacterium]|nr:alkaline phosphatase family protein [Acidobacteriota bacterium]
MHDTAVICVVGLASRFVGDHTPNLSRLQQEGAASRIHEITPAVTCSVQSTYVTGLLPSQHGIVANGWYFRDVAEVAFWKQSDHLVQGEKVWETARKRDSAFRCAKMFWWYNMYSSVDYSVTPRPIYRADGKKIFDIYGAPSSLPEGLKAELGDFPFTTFWGPMAGIDCSRWIAEASIKTYQWHRPTLTLIYLPHLDYDLQRYGPDHPSIPKQLKAIDEVCGRLIDFFRERGVRVMVLSEYGITPVQGPIHINRILRKEGWLRVRDEKRLEAFDAGASEVFAVADHQIAHIYVKDHEKVPQVRERL